MKIFIDFWSYWFVFDEYGNGDYFNNKKNNNNAGFSNKYQLYWIIFFL